MGKSVIRSRTDRSSTARSSTAGAHREEQEEVAEVQGHGGKRSPAVGPAPFDARSTKHEARNTEIVVKRWPVLRRALDHRLDRLFRQVEPRARDLEQFDGFVPPSFSAAL